MSSPIAKHRKNKVAQGLMNTHQKLSHSTRIEVLAEHLTKIIEETMPKDASSVRCLDVGCGDMVLAEKIQNRIPGTDWTCMDIYPLPKHLQDDPKWKKYRAFDGKNIPLPDNFVHVVLLCDVLHHSGEALSELITECARVADYVLIKDHYEYGFFSRQVLRLMDIVGNWGYGVAIPKRYFTPKYFHALCDKNDLKIIQENVGLQLYQHLPIIRSIIRLKWHFIALLRGAGKK